MDTGRRRFLALPTIAGDTLLTLLAIAYAILHLMVTRRPGPAADDTWAFVLAVLCAASLLGRSRWPLGTLLAVGGFGALYLRAEPDLFPILPAVLIALCSAVAYSRRPRRQVWSVAIGVAALLNLVRITSDFELSRTVTGFLLDSGWMLIALLLGEALRSRHVLAHEAELRALEAERTRHEEAQRRVVEERLRIARELHDILAHTLALINVQAGVAAHVIDQQPEQAREALTHIKTASRATLQELRALVGVLRAGDEPAPLTPAPGLDSLDELVDTVRDAGLSVDLQVARSNGPLPATVDVTAYRILQEALTNSIKHAGRGTVQVSVRQDGPALELDVTDRGGAAPAVRGDGSGQGIPGMRERAAAIGGSLEAGPIPGGGFRVHAILPVPGGSG